MKSGINYYIRKKNISNKCIYCRSFGENNPFYGKQHTEETKNKIAAINSEKFKGENNPFYGKSHTDEVKQHLSKIGKESNNGENNPFYGKKHTEETKQILREKTTNYFKNLSENEYYDICDKMSKGQINLYLKDPESYIKNKRKAAYISLKSQNKKYIMNNPETKFLKELERRNIDSYFKYSIIIGNYQYDFGNKDNRILIEIQGDYWHGNPNMFSNDKISEKRLLNETQKAIIEKDKLKKEFALKHNFKIYYIWENEINNNDYSILDVIETYLNQGKHE